MKSRTHRPSPRFLAGFLLVALLLAGVVSFWASSSPDGLNKVAIDHGFDTSETGHATADSPFAGYGTSGVGNEWASNLLAGVAGVGATALIGGVLFTVVRRRTPGSAPSAE